MTYTYRTFEERDLPGVLQLWEEHSGWGGLDAERWRSWYMDTPYGSSLIVVVEGPDGQIAGQTVLMPGLLWVGGREVRVARISAPILSPSIRRLSIRHPSHPAVNIHAVALHAAAEQGFALAYAVPDPAWLAFFRWGWRFEDPVLRFADIEHPCVERPLTSRALGSTPAEGREIIPATEFGAEYDDLWDGARTGLPVGCGLVRCADRLRYKNGGHLTLELRARGGALVGYSAIHRRSGLLVDVLARTPGDLREVLTATGDWLAAHSAEHGFAALKAMATPALGPTLDALGFAPVDHTFAFVCNPLDPSLPREAVAPERWYLTPGD